MSTKAVIMSVQDKESGYSIAVTGVSKADKAIANGVVPKYTKEYFEQRIQTLQENLTKVIPNKDRIEDTRHVLSQVIQSYQCSKESWKAASKVWDELQHQAKDHPDSVDPSLLDKAQLAVKKAQDVVERLSTTVTTTANSLVESTGLLEALKKSDGCCCSSTLQSLLECTVLVQATPKALSEWCAQNQNDHGKLLEAFLSNTDRMKIVIEAGGPVFGNYGPMLAVWSQLKAQMKEKMLHFYTYSTNMTQTLHVEKLALAVALEHSVPISIFKATEKKVDPIQRFWHYVDAYLDGDLDAAFDRLEVWELRLVVDSDATHEDLTWGREYLKAYRPDDVTMQDEHWRYAMAVKTDVGYRQPDHEFTNYKELVSAGGKCGPRAFFGRFLCKAWGIPTWGIRQPGHAAMTRWTSNGWAICLGAFKWDISFWQEMRYNNDNKIDRYGTDFLEETKARAKTWQYQDCVLLECLAESFGETLIYDFADDKFWRCLALAKRKTLAASQPSQHSLIYSNISNDIVAMSACATIEDKNPNEAIQQGSDGIFVVPAAFFAKNTSKNVAVMNSFLGGQQIHFTEHKDGLVEYNLPAFLPRGSYTVSLKIVNIHRNQVPLEIDVDDPCLTSMEDFVIVSAKETQVMEVPYTAGEWLKTSNSIQVELGPGSTLRLSRKGPCWGLTMKELTLTRVEG